MHSAYKHIFFDLDHTLWDFDRNCAETLHELFHTFELNHYGFTPDQLVEKYQEINYRMWNDYHRGKIGKEEIRKTRFPVTFEALGINPSHVPEKIDEAFLKICPARGNVMPYAHEVLNYLSGKYTLHIITNGFKDTQGIKLSTSKLDPYFSEVILAEHCGYSKPDRKIFEYALDKVNGKCEECIMIGDDLYTDVLGAKQAGLDHVYFNPKETTHNENITFEIKCLSELMKIL